MGEQGCSFHNRDTSFEYENGDRGRLYTVYSYSADIAEVTVDTRTRRDEVTPRYGRPYDVREVNKSRPWPQDRPMGRDSSRV